MNDYKIWVTYHKDEQVSEYGLKDDDTHILFATHKDIAGKNINPMNPVLSEMVTMWYVWKNPSAKSSYVGFNHYRRRFDVAGLPGKGECQVFNIKDFGQQTIYQQYCQWHNGKDMDVMLGILESKYGNGNVYSKHILEGTRLVSNCCFLMKWGDFTKLCKFLFPLLDEYAAQCGCSTVEDWHEKTVKDFGDRRIDYQMRGASFLAERLVSAWIMNNLSPYIGHMNVAVVHYNTPELTEAAILSLKKHTPGCRVYVFDNSDKKPFVTKMDNVEVIDNTKGQLIDFEKVLEAYPEKWERDVKKSNYGSAKHSLSVEKLMELIPEGFVLMDSDVLFKGSIKKLWNRSVACAGTEEVKHNIPLLMPFLCYINVPVIAENGITYFNGEKMWALSNVEPNQYYDTGAWFLEQVRSKNLPVEYVNIWQYVIHLGHGSWRGQNSEKWLKENEHLWK